MFFRHSSPRDEHGVDSGGNPAHVDSVDRNGLGWAPAFAGVTKKFGLVLPVLCILLSCFGIWRAFAADDEGLMATRRELVRYDAIRKASASILPPDAVVISARSDKIFFPTWRAVSPIPSETEIAKLTTSPSHPFVALFARPPSQQEKDAWLGVGLESHELATFGRESLYQLSPRLPLPTKL